MDNYSNSSKAYLFKSKKRWKRSLWILSIGLMYLVTFLLIEFFGFKTNHIAVVWPLNSILAGGLLLSQRRFWKYILPVVLVSNFLGNYLIGTSITMSVGFAIANVLEGSLISFFLCRWFYPRNGLESYRILLLFLAAISCASLIGAVLGAATYSINNGTSSFLSFAGTWFSADLLGNLLGMSLILSWNTPITNPLHLKPARKIEAFLFLLTIIVVGVLIFSSNPKTNNLMLHYALFPILIWAGFRFELKGASLCALMIAVISDWYTVQGLGPFILVGSNAQEHVLWLQIYLVIAIITTISVAVAVIERKQANNYLRELRESLFQAQKMEAIGQIAASTAHDFKNIIFGIQLTSKAMDLEITDSKFKAYTRNIDKSSIIAAELVAKFISYSRGDSTVMSKINASEVVKNVNRMLAHRLDKSITVELEENQTIMILGDLTELVSAILNLCINASHAMPNGGTLTISCSLKRVSSNKPETSIEELVIPNNYACLLVKDTGHGMSADVLRKAFDPYFTAKKGNIGTGLGLAGVKRVVEEHSGYIQVDSKIDEGTHFRVLLPSIGMS